MVNIKHTIIQILKNLLKILSGIVCGWFFFYWFAYCYIGITDLKDAEAEEMVPFAWFMVVTGIILVTTREFIMYKLSSNWKNYLIYSLVPFILTAGVLYIAVIHLWQYWN